MKTVEALDFLQHSLNDLCDAFNNEWFSPILEADITAFLYHRLLVNGCPANTVNVDTRVCGFKERNRKYDLVIGALDKKGACVEPVLIAQIKAFQRWGLSDQQHRRRFEGVIYNDIPSLEEAAMVLEGGRVQIITDLYLSAQSEGYLAGWWHDTDSTKKDLLVKRYSEIGAWLFWVRPLSDGSVGLETLVNDSP